MRRIRQGRVDQNTSVNAPLPGLSCKLVHYCRKKTLPAKFIGSVKTKNKLPLLVWGRNGELTFVMKKKKEKKNNNILQEKTGKKKEENNNPHQTVLDMLYVSFGYPVFWHQVPSVIFM